MKDALNKLKDNIPLISAILVFLGYWNLDSYYRCFGIEIYNYISASEILLSFMQIIKTIVYQLIILSIIAFILLISSAIDAKNQKIDGLEQEETEESAEGGLKFNLLKILVEIKGLFSVNEFFVREKYIWNLFFLIVRIMLIVVSIGAFIFTIGLGQGLLKDINNPINLAKNFKGTSGITFLFICLGYAYMHNTIFKHLEHPLNTFFNKYWFPIVFVLIYVAINYQYNLMRVTKVLMRTESRRVAFIIDDKEYKTDSSLLYIGHTQSYIFFRSYYDSTNVIYKISDIKKLVIDKNN